MNAIRFLAAAVIALAAFVAQANEYRYDAKTRLSWKDGVAYVLKYRWEYKTYCDRYGCCYQKKVSVPYYEPADVKTIYEEKIVKEGGDPVTLIADILKSRDAWLLPERSRVAKEQSFVRLLQETGLSQNFRVEGYGADLGYGTDPLLRSTDYQQELGQVGDTQYGYSATGFKAVTSVARGADLTEYSNRRQNTIDALHALGGEESRRLDEFQSENASQNSEVLTAKLANDALLEMAKQNRELVRDMAVLRQTLGQSGKDTTTETRQSWEVRPRSTRQRSEKPNAFDAAERIIIANCTSCHSGDNAKGGSELFPEGFAVESLASLSREQWGQLSDLVESEEMPRPLPNSGGHARPLSQADKDVIKLAALTAQ